MRLRSDTGGGSGQVAMAVHRFPQSGPAELPELPQSLCFLLVLSTTDRQHAYLPPGYYLRLLCVAKHRCRTYETMNGVAEGLHALSPTRWFFRHGDSNPRRMPELSSRTRVQEVVSGACILVRSTLYPILMNRPMGLALSLRLFAPSRRLIPHLRQNRQQPCACMMKVHLRSVLAFRSFCTLFLGSRLTTHQNTQRVLL